MPITGVSDPDELGGRTFRVEDEAGARELYFHGPDAEALAREIQASAPADDRLAQAGGMSVDPMLGGMSQAPPPAPPPVQTPTPMAGAGGLGNVPAPAPDAAWQATGQTGGEALGTRTLPPPMQKGLARAGVPPPALPPLSAAMPGAPGSGPLDPLQAEIDAPVVVPGQPGVDPQRMLQEGVMVPTGGAIEVQDAQPFDQDAAETRADVSLAEDELRYQQSEREAREAHLQDLQLAAALPEYEMRAAEAQYARDEAENRYRAERADVEQLLYEHRQKKVDPARYWASKSEFGKFTTRLSVALGALAAGLTGGPNFAQEWIQQEIEQDIAAQEGEIAQSGENARNALAMLQQRYGDVEQAKAALRIAMNDVAVLQGKQIAAEFGTQQAMDAYNAWAIQNMKERTEQERAFRAAAMGKRTERVAQAFVQPRAATGPTTRAPTLAERAKRAEYAGKIAEYGRRIGGGGVGPEEEKRFYQYAKDREGIEKASEALRATITKWRADQERFGFVPGLDPASQGALGDTAQSFTRGGHVVGRVLGVDASDTAATNVADAADLRILVQSAIKGIPSDKDQRLIDESLKGIASGKDTLRRAEIILQTFDRSLRTIDAGASPRFRRELDHRKGAIDRINQAEGSMRPRAR